MRKINDFSIMRFMKHSLFWLLVTVVLTLIFGRSIWSYKEAFYFVTMLIPVAIITGYFFNYYLIPKYLLTNRFFLFALYSVYTLIVSILLELLVIVFSFIVLANYSYDKLIPVSADIFSLSFVLYAIVLLFSFARLIRVYMSIKKRMFELEWEKDKNEQQFINVRSDRKTVRISLDKIIYIESYSDYIKIHTSESETITKEKISRMAELLPDSFIRIHRSFIVNVDYIVSFNREEVTLANLELPFGRAFKTTALKRLEA